MILKEESLVADYTDRIKRSNKKLDHWRAYLKAGFAADSRFSYMGISILDVLAAGLAVRDWPSFSRYRGKSRGKRIVSLSVFNCFKEHIKILRLIALSFIPSILKDHRTDVPDMVFVAFERRQAGTFIDAMNILNGQGRPTGMLTTRIAGHDFPPDLNLRHRAIYLEDYFNAGSYIGLLTDYLRINKWLNDVIQSSASLPDDFYTELSIFIKEIKGQLLQSLFFIKAARSFIAAVKPRAVLAADNADIRARAVFLAAKECRISTFHIPFGFIDLECYEEKYPVADRKFVLSEEQKDTLIKIFNLPEGMLTVLGCPRYDNLFRIRNKIGINRRAGSFTVLFGSQPSARNGYSPFVREIKMKRVRDLLQFVSRRPAPVKLLIKPHPDESKEDVRNIATMAERMGVDFEIIDYIDFEQMKSEVDFFISFESMLSLEFIILGIPAGFLVSVKEVPIFNKACVCGLAIELPAGNDWDDRVDSVCVRNAGGAEAREAYLKSEFTNTDGTASRDLVNMVLDDMKRSTRLITTEELS